MANAVYAGVSLTGGGAGALDAIPDAFLNDGDIGIVATEHYFYIYHFDNASADAEDSPSVIKPDDAGGNGRWILVDGWGSASNASLGIGTSLPGENVCGGADDLLGVSLHVYNSGGSARLVAEGSASATLDLIDLGGGANDKFLQLVVNSGVAEFQSFTDALAVRVNQIFQMDLGTGYVSFGTSAHANSHMTVEQDVNTTNIAFWRHTQADPYGFYMDWTGGAPNNQANYFFTGADTDGVEFRIWSDGSYAQASGEDRKKNIKPLPSMINKVKMLDPKEYHTKGQSDIEQKRIGLLSEDVALVIPEAISDLEPDDPGKNLGLNYQTFIPVLIKSFQELLTRVEALEGV